MSGSTLMPLIVAGGGSGGGGGGGGGGLTVTIGPGGSATSGRAHWTFPPNTAVPAGGTGPYTYLWMITADDSGGATLAGGSTATATLTMPDGDCTVACRVTDSAVPAHVATSNPAAYSFTSTLGGTS